jgi:dolichyl-phosphate-mannose--protein O-mannosyl transferase
MGIAGTDCELAESALRPTPLQFFKTVVLRAGDFGPMTSSRLRGYFIVAAIGLAAAFSIWAVAVMASDLMREDSHTPSALYLLWFLLLAMFWSGLSLLRWRTTLAIVVLLLSAAYAMPLGLLIVILRAVDD